MSVHVVDRTEGSGTPARAHARALPFVIVLAAAVLLRIVLLDRPFLPSNEGTAAGIPVMHALNFARYGPMASHFAGVLNAGRVRPANWTLYAHHPPLEPLAVALAYRAVGVSDWSSRVVPAAFSIATIVLLYAIALRRFGAQVALLAALFFAFAPSTVTFGAMPDYITAQLAFFMLACAEAYLRWRESGRRQWAAATALLFTLGALTDWPMFYLVPPIALHYWRTIRDVRRTAALLAIPVVLLAGLILWMDGIEGTGAFAEQFGVRMARATTTWARWIQVAIAGNVATLLTWPVFVLAAAYAGWLVRLTVQRDRATARQHALPAILLILTALHLVIGREGNMQPWWSVVTAAPLALAAALAVDLLGRRLNKPRVVTWVAIATFAIFAAPTAYDMTREQWGYTKDAGYSVRELASVIRSISQPDEAVLTSDYLDPSTLLFYADRQIRAAVLDVDDLADAMTGNEYTLAFGYTQSGGPRPRWFVMPPPDRASLPELAATLDARFPRRMVGPYAVYRFY